MMMRWIIIRGKRRNIGTVGGRETSHDGLTADMLGTTNRHQDDRTPTDTDGPATSTTGRSRGLKNDRDRRGRDLRRRRVVDTTTSRVVILSRRRQQQRHTHSITVLNDTGSVRHVTTVVTPTIARRGTQQRAASRVNVIGRTGNGLVRSRVTSAGLDPRQGLFISAHHQQSCVDFVPFMCIFQDVWILSVCY